MALIVGQTGRLQVRQQPYCTREKAFTGGCHPKSVLHILYRYIQNTVFIYLFFLKPLNVSMQIAGLLWLHVRFFQPFEVSVQTDCTQTCYILGCLWTYGGAVWFGATPVSTCGHTHLYYNLNRWVPVGYFFYREKHCWEQVDIWLIT